MFWHNKLDRTSGRCFGSRLKVGVKALLHFSSYFLTALFARMIP